MSPAERERFAKAVLVLRGWHAPDAAGKQLRAELLSAGEWMGRAVYGAERYQLLARCHPLTRLVAQFGTAALFALWESEAQALMQGSRVRGWIPACLQALPASGAALAGVTAARLGGWA